MSSLDDGGTQTDPERRMAMRSFPAIVHQLMEQFSRDQDVHWLRSGLDDGHFDYAEAFNEGTPEQAFKKIDSAMAFLKTAHYARPPLGTIETPMLFLSFTVNHREWFVPFFDDFVDRMVEQSALLNPTKNIGPRWGQLRDVLGKVLLGAIAIDSPASVEKLLKAHSSLVEQLYPCSVIGSDLRDTITQAEKCEFTPYFFAMQLGREDCMKVLVEGNANLDRIGVRRSDPTAQSSKPTEKAIGLLDHMDYSPTCKRPSFELALQQWKDQQLHDNGDPAIVAQTIHRAGIAMLDAMTNKGPTVRKRAYIECFEAMGAYNHKPTESFVQACHVGRPDIAERVQGTIDWALLRAQTELGTQQEEHSFAMRALRAGDKAGGDSSQRMGLMLMHRTIGEGVYDKVFAQTPIRNERGLDAPEGGVLSQPAAFMIDMSHLGMLAIAMKQGLDPTVALFQRSLSPLAYAEATGKHEAVHTMRTFLARQNAMSALEELETPNRTPSL